VNVLNAIPGTPYENLPKLTNDEVCRIVAIYRFIVPEASIRLAGGRGLLGDKVRRRSGVARMHHFGDMLTTAGISVETIALFYRSWVTLSRSEFMNSKGFS
jgi:biotin synthase